MPTTNDQSTQTTQSTTPVVNTEPTKENDASVAENLDFDINLDIATDDTSTPVDINKEPDNKVGETPINQVEDLSLDLPDSYSPEKIEENKEPHTEIEKTSPDTWLQEQDKKNKEEEVSLFFPASEKTIDQVSINEFPVNDTLVNKINSDNTNQVEETLKPAPTINIDINQTKSETYDINKTDYSGDMKIIEEISGVKPAEANVSNSPVGIAQINSDLVNNNNIDLDSLIEKTPDHALDTSIPSINGEVEKTEKNALFPDFDTAKDENQEIKSDSGSTLEVKTVSDINAPINGNDVVSNVEVNKPKLNHLWKMILPIGGTVAVLAVLGYFIITTMYPVETQNIIGEETTQVAVNTGTEQTGAIEELSGGMIAIETGEVISGDMVVVEESTTNLDEGHGASAEFDSLGELTDEMSSQGQIEEQSMVDKLKAMATEANSFLSQGQATNNKIYIKYGGTIGKKCNELISALESGQEIDNLEGNLAQLEGYLQKLRDINNAETQQSSGTTQNTVVESEQTTIGSQATTE